VTKLLRLLTRPVLSAAVLSLALPCITLPGLVAPAFAAAPGLPASGGDSFGSYLAGQQALRDLSTTDAARLLGDASNAEEDNPAVVQQAFLAFLADGDIEHAGVVAKHMLELKPDNGLAKLVLAATDLKDRRYKAVEKELADLTSNDFSGITGTILKAWALIGEGREDDAFSSLDRLSKGGLDDFLMFHRALMADVAGDSAAAINLAGKAYSASPTAPRSVELYARVLANAGRFDDSLAVIDKFDNSGLGDPVIDTIRKQITAHQRPGLYAPNAQAGAAETFHGIAVPLARDGNNGLAVGLLQVGFYLDPHNDVIPLLIGQLLDQAGQHAAANGFYANIPATSPMHVTAAVRIAQNYDSMGNRPEALNQLGKLADTNPGDIDTLTVYADTLRGDKQYDKAADIYSKALALDSGAHFGDWVLYYQRGIAYERGGHWDKAQPDFLKALDLNPDQPQVLNYLGYTWVDKGQNLDQALDMIQKAVKATPTDGFIVDSLGWAFYRLGRFDDAVKTLEQAVQFKPNDPQINDHLGDAYWKAGRKLEAHFQWNVAASLDPDADLKASLARKQASGLDSTTVSASAATVAATPTTTQ
jgi:tetratricopeptide (TPR) repeat protein